MKRLLTILLVLAGIAFTHSAFAQTADPGKKKEAKKVDSTSTKSTQKSGSGNSSGGAGITIDESGAPKAKTKQGSAAPSSGTPAADPSAPKDASKEQSSAKSTDDDAPSSAADIAIDESGTSKVKKEKAASKNNAAPSNADSTIVGPANDVARPQFQ